MTVTSKPFITQPQVNYVAGGPEALFRVGAVTADAASAASTMQTGPWTLGPDGRASAGSLGVLLDVVHGGAAVANRPPQTWAVSTEIQVDFCTPLPAGHSTLSAQAGTIHRDGNGALAQGSVTDEDDRLVAAEPLHRGRTLAVVRVQCLRPDDKPFAVATVSYQRPA